MTDSGFPHKGANAVSDCSVLLLTNVARSCAARALDAREWPQVHHGTLRNDRSTPCSRDRVFSGSIYGLSLGGPKALGPVAPLGSFA
jgi:hypothetical protein